MEGSWEGMGNGARSVGGGRGWAGEVEGRQGAEKVQAYKKS